MFSDMNDTYVVTHSSVYLKVNLDQSLSSWAPLLGPLYSSGTEVAYAIKKIYTRVYLKVYDQFLPAIRDWS